MSLVARLKKEHLQIRREYCFPNGMPSVTTAWFGECEVADRVLPPDIESTGTSLVLKSETLSTPGHNRYEEVKAKDAGRFQSILTSMDRWEWTRFSRKDFYDRYAREVSS